MHDTPSLHKLLWTAAALDHRVALTQSESSAIHNFDQHYTTLAARLTSPPFSSFPPPWWWASIREGWGNVAHEPYWSPQSQVRRILDRLHWVNLNPGESGITAILINETCRLKIGVTIHNTTDFDGGIQRIKTLLKAAVLCERQFDTVQNIQSIRRGSMNVLEWLRKIQAQHTHAQLADLARRLPTNVTLSGRHKRQRSAASPHSVWQEFPASLEVEAILSLIEVCKRLVHWSASAQPNTLHDLLTSSCTDLLCTLPRFLEGIGLGESALSHFKARQCEDGWANSYANRMFVRTMEGVALHHPLWLLLHHTALARLWNTHEINIEMILNEKIRGGEYGWLPVGPALLHPAHQSYTATTPPVSAKWLPLPVWHYTPEPARWISPGTVLAEWSRRDSVIVPLAGTPSSRPPIPSLSLPSQVSFTTDLSVDEDGKIEWNLFSEQDLAKKFRSQDDWAVTTQTSRVTASHSGSFRITRASVS